ncbi:hypothetical protein F5148DRAFT_14184 [Russula earlei]|uniref:Uncharacterized protein n=1 Tax=Russula earlei TaxID=71964 RepID=A0ACC0UL33_9AGAM|nr:hypothetical protein F5148DRAFT_14184 [Russula earlei]
MVETSHFPASNARCLGRTSEIRRKSCSIPLTLAPSPPERPHSRASERRQNTQSLLHMNPSPPSTHMDTPHTRSLDIDHVDAILTSAHEGSTKPFIIGITSSSPISLASMLDSIQRLRANSAMEKAQYLVLESSSIRVVRTSRVPPPISIPHIRSHTRPRHTRTVLLGGPDPRNRSQASAICVLDPVDELLQVIATYSRPDPSDESRRLNPFAFLTSTNTLGKTLFFAERAVPLSAKPASASHPPVLLCRRPLGGMAGEALHPLALSNVYLHPATATRFTCGYLPARDLDYWRRRRDHARGLRPHAQSRGVCRCLRDHSRT